MIARPWNLPPPPLRSSTIIIIEHVLCYTKQNRIVPFQRLRSSTVFGLHHIKRLSIVNLVKSGSLYNEGMRPLMYSEIDAKESKIGWRRCGDNIAYFKNEDSSYVIKHLCILYTI